VAQTPASIILSRIALARRLDPANTTYRQLAAELGISESSIYKMRAGTRSGRRLAVPLMKPPNQSGYIVKFESASGRVASRNIIVPGDRRAVDAIVMRHDPRVRRSVVKQLEKEEQGRVRRAVGSPAWTRKDRRSLKVTEVHQTKHQRTEAFSVQERRVYPDEQQL
jgi:hypothetical protein